MRLRFGPVTFAVVFCIVYAAVFAANLPLFLYYPLHDQFAWGIAPLKGAGPGMAWYGFMTDAALVGGIAAVLLPDRFADRMFRNFLWLFPCGAMLACVYLVRPFFLNG